MSDSVAFKSREAFNPLQHSTLVLYKLLTPAFKHRSNLGVAGHTMCIQECCRNVQTFILCSTYVVHAYVYSYLCLHAAKTYWIYEVILQSLYSDCVKKMLLLLVHPPAIPVQHYSCCRNQHHILIVYNNRKGQTCVLTSSVNGLEATMSFSSEGTSSNELAMVQ